MHTRRVRIEPTMKVNIHNQCSNFWLKNGMCFGAGIDWNKKPSGEVYTGYIMSADLIPLLATFEGALTYDLHIGVESTYIRLFLTWKSEAYKKFCVFVHLVECEKWSMWDKHELEEYCQRYASQLCTYTGPIRDTWLMPDGTVLMTKLELDFTRRDGVLSLTIYRGIKGERTKKLEWFKLKR
jgi:hypothetical protein